MVAGAAAEEGADGAGALPVAGWLAAAADDVVSGPEGTLPVLGGAEDSLPVLDPLGVDAFAVEASVAGALDVVVPWVPWAGAASAWAVLL